MALLRGVALVKLLQDALRQDTMAAILFAHNASLPLSPFLYASMKCCVRVKNLTHGWNIQ